MKKYIVSLFFLCFTSVLASGCSQADAKTVDPEKSEFILKLVAYNVGVFSKYMDDSTQDVAKMMQELGADAIALCELDSCNRRHGTFQLKDFAGILSEEGSEEWDYRFGRAMKWNGGSYGVGVVLRAEIGDSYIIELPKGDGSEPRACMVAETADYVMAAVHLDHKSEGARKAQAKILTDELKRRYGSSSKPVFLCGDFNAKPDSPTLNLLSEDWTVLSEMTPTHPSTNPQICIDYVMALNNSAIYEVLKTEVCTESESADVRETSDHLPVYVEVKIR